MGLSATAFRNRLVCLGALGAALLAATPGAAGERLVDLELVLAVDISGSVDDEEAVLQRDGFLAAITDAQVLAAIRAGYHGRIAVSYVEWAGDGQAETIGDWTEIHDETGARAFARGIEAKPVTVKLWASISGVIAHAMAGFRSNGFRGKRRIIDIAGDGPNNRGTRVTVARDQAVAEGITINGLSIINGRRGRFGFLPMQDLDLYYEGCVIGGPGAFLIVADTYRDFARAVRRKLILEIAARPPGRSSAVLLHAAVRSRPPCDYGERQMMLFYDDH